MLVAALTASSIAIPARGVGLAREAQPEPLTVAHPDDPTKRVEYFLEKPAGSGPFPTIVFLHGHQDPPSVGARVYVSSGTLVELARRGLLAVAVSLPGYGGSTGTSDFAGPFSVDGVDAVIDILQKAGLAAHDRIAIEGVSLGAMTAGMIAAQRPWLAGVVMISGEYDLPDELVHPRSALARQIAESAAVRLGGAAGLRSRSVITVASRIKVPVLILGGAEDDRTNPIHGQQLADSINASGGHARFVLILGYGHRIPPQVRAPEVDPFLARVLKR